MNPENTIATAPHTSLWVCGTGPAQQPQQQQQNTAATVCTQYGCQPATQHGGHAGHQHQNTAATVCTQYGCQPQQNANVSVPPHCPTVAPMCPPPAYGGGQAQAQFPTWPIGQCTIGVTTGILTAVAGCDPQQGQQAQAQGSFYTQQCGGQPAQMSGGAPQATVQSTAQSTGWGVTHGPVCPTYVCNQTWPSPMCGGGPMGGAQAQGLPHTSFGCVVQPHTFAGCQPTQSVAGCTTIAGLTHNPPMCPPPPANAGGQAQAQFPTWPPAQCTHVLTYVFGCAQQGQQAQPQGAYPQQGQQAQAQGSYYTMTCPAPQAQGQQQALPHTIFPPVCHAGGGNTGAYTHLFGCTTVTSTPTTPSTHFPGCTGVTATPVTVGQTHLMGCTTITSTPHTQAQASDNGWTAVKACTTYAVAPAQASNNGWTAVPACTTYAAAPAPMQGNAQAQYPGGQAGTLPHTYHPAGGCGPVAPAANANGGGQAQAQIPTIPVLSCATQGASAIGACTGIIFVC